MHQCINFCASKYCTYLSNKDESHVPNLWLRTEQPAKYFAGCIFCFAGCLIKHDNYVTSIILTFFFSILRSVFLIQNEKYHTLPGANVIVGLTHQFHSSLASLAQKYLTFSPQKVYNIFQLMKSCVIAGRYEYSY